MDQRETSVEQRMFLVLYYIGIEHDVLFIRIMLKDTPVDSDRGYRPLGVSGS